MTTQACRFHMICAAVFSAVFAASPVTAQDQTSGAPLTAKEFERYTQGKTVFFGSEGQIYGAETYLRNRYVRWSFLDGRCSEGHWHPQDDQICFVYEGNQTPQCWLFWLSPDGLNADFLRDGNKTRLYELPAGDNKLICPGPEIGV